MVENDVAMVTVIAQDPTGSKSYETVPEHLTAMST